MAVSKYQMGVPAINGDRHERAGNIGLHVPEEPVCVRYSVRANATFIAHRRALERVAACQKKACQKCGCRCHEQCAESAGGSERAAHEARLNSLRFCT